MGNLVVEELTLFCQFVVLQSEGDPGDALSEKSMEASSDHVRFILGRRKLIMGDNSRNVFKEC